MLESLRGAIPAARGLPLLRALALAAAAATQKAPPVAPRPHTAVLDYLGDLRLALRVEPC